MSGFSVYGELIMCIYTQGREENTASWRSPGQALVQGTHAESVLKRPPSTLLATEGKATQKSQNQPTLHHSSSSCLEQFPSVL